MRVFFEAATTSSASRGEPGFPAPMPAPSAPLHEHVQLPTATALALASAGLTKTRGAALAAARACFVAAKVQLLHNDLMLHVAPCSVNQTNGLGLEALPP